MKGVGKIYVSTINLRKGLRNGRSTNDARALVAVKIRIE